jgi:Ser/Thr protein kinase RdoA (MazF antagonist)
VAPDGDLEQPAERSPDTLGGTESAVLGMSSRAAVQRLFDGYLRQHLGSGIARIRFRSGRIDVVWGIELDDGRSVVVKASRPPVDIDALRAACEAQRVLIEAGFPAPAPLAGPDVVEGHVITAEALLEGEAPDARVPANRRLLAAGLAEHIDLLRGHPDLLDRTGTGPSWCRYQAGPWPTPHDTIVDFSSIPAEYAWLDEFGRAASAQVLDARGGTEPVVAHADWYAGNALVRDGALVGVVDWELVADTEAVIAGFVAAGFATSATGGGGLSTPEEAAVFLDDYIDARGRPFTARERRAAGGGTAWIVAFNSRWQVGLLHLGAADLSTIDLARQRRSEYLALGS